MALPESGRISLSDVRTELEKSGKISLGDTDVRNLAEKTSGIIKMSDLYGKSSFPSFPKGISYMTFTLNCTMVMELTGTKYGTRAGGYYGYVEDLSVGDTENGPYMSGGRPKDIVSPYPGFDLHYFYEHNYIYYTNNATFRYRQWTSFGFDRSSGDLEFWKKVMEGVSLNGVEFINPNTGEVLNDKDDDFDLPLRFGSFSSLNDKYTPKNSKQYIWYDVDWKNGTAGSPSSLMDNEPMSCYKILNTYGLKEVKVRIKFRKY